ncbi:MAG: sugar-binding protein [Verrucomicrobiota bacterium]
MILVALLFLAPRAWSASLALSDQGIGIDAGNMGQFNLGLPLLMSDTQDKTYKPVEKSVAGDQVIVKYEGGGTVTVHLQRPDTITFECAHVALGARKLRVEMLIDFGFNDGGTWQAGDKPPTPFPKQKPDRPFLFQGHSTAFKFANAQGKMLTFELPAYTYQQLQDNREWNWPIFDWIAFIPLDPAHPRVTLRIAESVAAGGEKRIIIADRFGQDQALDFPGKIKNEEMLKQDVAADDAYYSSLRPPATDAFGGSPGSGAKYGLKRTGYFHIERVAAKFMLVNPEGNATFHLGICGFQPSDDFTYLEGRESAYEWLPAYDSEFKTAFAADPWWSHRSLSFYVANLIRKYGKAYDANEWAARVIPRVRQWGFNASGDFSSVTAAQKEARFPYVLGLPLGPWDLGAPIEGVNGLFDPFDSAAIAKMDKLLAEQVAPKADDSLLIGYFLANEQAFEDIPRTIPSLTGGQTCKRRLVSMLQDKYQTMAAFNQAWAMEAAGFEALVNIGLPVTTPQAAADTEAFTGLFIDEYFRRITETFHKYDRNHLLLGNRWQPGTANNEQLCRLAAKYMDVISVNYYTYGLDEAFLNRIHAWSVGKPMMLSEFYWSSPSDTGLPGGKEVNSQRERGLAYRNYVEQSAALGYVVGIEWFTLIDQARTGRFFEKYNGEKANTGLLNVADRPYKDCLAEMSRANYGIYDVLLAGKKPFHYDNPLFKNAGEATRIAMIPRATGPIQLDGRRDGWPGIPPEQISPNRLVEGASAQGVEGVFRLCWDDANLYVLVEVTDPTPMKNNHAGSSIWAGDAIELFVGHEQIDQPAQLLSSDRQILLSAGNVGRPQWYCASAPQSAPLKLAVIPNVNGQGYTLEAAIPFSSLGFSPKDGQTLLFDLAIDNSVDGESRTAQLVWNGAARNSTDRTHWGRGRMTR